MCAPTQPPTLAPTERPSERPTDAPTKIPTRAPAAPCGAGTTTTYWLYDPETSAPTRKLANKTATCLTHPYNVEVRPCDGTIADPDRPVQILLVRAADGSVVHKSATQRAMPYLLFDPASAIGSGVPSSPKPLPNGVYYLGARGSAAAKWGRLTITQDCPCPKGRKGKKGCRSSM